MDCIEENSDRIRGQTEIAKVVQEKQTATEK